MSSKGARVAGTDGSDYQHREQVASQYKISAQLKSTFRTCVLLNIAIVLVQVAALAAARLGLFESASDFHPVYWQYTWMGTGVLSLIGLQALRKNQVWMLSLHNSGLMMFGLGGLFFGLVAQYSSYQRYLITGEMRRLADVPVFLIWIAVFIPVAILYIVTMYYSLKLQRAWDVRKTR
ncbi:protein jagunal homolog 1-like [Diadema setosum]|uniref:protein jagunal homolog 1-like n=1 Tax=Diadema setosum TaxID=31175 RepID=UPI003B3BE7BA